MNWYKGNLHMHSYWSDGHDHPEAVAARYKDAGYNFIAFTEHDRHQLGTPPAQTVAKQPIPDHPLRQLADYRQTLEAPGRFLLLTGEEVTLHRPGVRHWINVIGAERSYGPLEFDGSAAAGIDHLVQLVRRQDPQALVSFNHPNFLWNANAEDLAAATSLNFYEIHTALNSTKSYGDGEHPGVEEMWDIALSLRLQAGQQPLLGLATDDAHRYDSPEACGFRAWIMVRAAELSREALLTAMRQGDFYGSTGVTLSALTADNGRLAIRVAGEAQVNYRIQFIGSRRDADLDGQPRRDADGAELPTTRRYSAAVGQLLAEVDGTEGAFELTPELAYVRALIVSDKPHHCPTVPGDVEKAWTQPLLNPGQP